ncbi:MAG: circadian clock protein LdpA [Cyanobacteriota bacterium]
MSDLDYPLVSLKEGHWFKLICGASFQHLRWVRSLSLAYTLAGADCIDVAADPAVIAAAKEGMTVAQKFAQTAAEKGFSQPNKPWLMVSFNDGEDPHFRKAQFDAAVCPSDCSRPCEAVCPADAIAFNSTISGVIDERCYGCGRCIPICPQQLIMTRSYVSTPEAIAPLMVESGIDAIEIHTQVGHLNDFQRLWNAIAPYTSSLKLLAISCPDHPNLIHYLSALHSLIYPLPCPLIWQTDGRPMSGDLGIGATRAAVKLAQKVLAAKLPGYVQLAGGTNQHTVTKLQGMGLLKSGHSERQNQSNPSWVSGIAYGSYARALLTPILDSLDAQKKTIVNASFPNSNIQLEDDRDLLWQAVNSANSLVSQIKLASKRANHVNSSLTNSR